LKEGEKVRVGERKDFLELLQKQTTSAGSNESDKESKKGGREGFTKRGRSRLGGKCKENS